jgi:predicted GNAT family acetyltransferase
LTTTGSDTITVTDNREHHRFEAHAGDTLAGFAAYTRTAELIAFLHTEVDPAFEGRGVGAALARSGVDATRAEGLRVLAVCPFIAGWLARHPEYADLEYRATSTVTD